jgi:diamine N-acetyltransferase
MAELSRVRSREQIPGIVDLASAIWTDHYVPLIGQKQVDYMLAKFQSEEAIKTQLSEGYEYYIVSHNGQRAGYMAIVPDEDAGMLLISKLYVLTAKRGRGFGRKRLEFAGYAV